MNSADSNQELLIMGEPRLSDIAPDVSFKQPSKSNFLKSQKTDFSNDLSYLPASLTEEHSDGFSENKVFHTENFDRYHNFPIKKRTSQRRHSIGNFIIRDKPTSKHNEKNQTSTPFNTVKEFFRKKDMNVGLNDHSVRHVSFPKKSCNKCIIGSTQYINMDDILLISLKMSNPASLWVDYFFNYFQQISKQANRKPFRIQYASLEEIVAKSDEEYNEFCSRVSAVKLELIVICPNFLELIADSSKDCFRLGKILLADRTLALLLGVTDDDFNESHIKVLPTYYQWQRKCVGQDQDENFTKEFLGQAMAILSKVWKQQISIITQEKSYFSITPKKIHQGQNSVFVILTYPLQKEDIVKISVEKNGDLYVITNVKRRNPYIIKFWMPEALTELTAIVNILVEKNGSVIGSRPIKCESRMRELEEILRSINPIDFMCQAIGFSTTERDHIDNWLVHNFQKNLPPHFNLLANCDFQQTATIQGHKRSHEEFPTLLHFAAKFGLQKLAIQLLECPGADIANEIRNIFDLTPLELAEINGFSTLAILFKDYININEFTNMYAKLMEMSLYPKPEEKGCDGYMLPKSMQQFYKMCPAPRPVLKELSLSSLSNSGNEWSPNLEYITMHTPVSLTKEDPSPTHKNNLGSNELTITKEHTDLLQKKSKLNKKSEEIEDKVQKELVEIINDFKNNIHSITQAEKLVEEWKNRNDVQKSFKEKQDQLLEMRNKYEQIQNKMKSTMKKATPFERMKKLFSKRKHDNTQKFSFTKSDCSLNTRPVRSSSTSSSGSSGRISTISASSLGDSGTLSDNEDKTETSLNTLGNLDLLSEFYIQYPPSGLPVPGCEDLQRKDQNINNEYENIESSPFTSHKHEYINFKVSNITKLL